MGGKEVVHKRGRGETRRGRCLSEREKKKIAKFLNATRVDTREVLFRLVASFVLGGLIGLEREGIEIKSLDVSQSFEEKTLRMRLVVRIREETGWRDLYKKLGALEGVSKISPDQKI